MWSPTSSVGIIDPDGIWNASTTNARSTSAMATATPIDSEYSRIVDLRANARFWSMRSSSVAIALRGLLGVVAAQRLFDVGDRGVDRLHHCGWQRAAAALRGCGAPP